MDKRKYIILELIPTALKPENGDIVQLSAIKLDGYKLIDRFDYRLNENKISNVDLIDMISYDKNMFKYVDDSSMIIDDLKKWSDGYDLLIIDNAYTENYLLGLDNKIESIFKYLNEKFSDDIIEKIINKYNLKPSNYIVDLLFEALIEESNMKGE